VQAVTIEGLRDIRRPSNGEVREPRRSAPPADPKEER
jgi:hypothetical protein